MEHFVSFKIESVLYTEKGIDVQESKQEATKPVSLVKLAENPPSISGFFLAEWLK